MRQATTYRSEIRKFLDTFFGGPSKAATMIGVHYGTVRRWEDDPEQMLKYLYWIEETSEAKRKDVKDAIKRQMEMNDATRRE